jgi:hypothetical protein
VQELTSREVQVSVKVPPGATVDGDGAAKSTTGTVEPPEELPPEELPPEELPLLPPLLLLPQAASRAPQPSKESVTNCRTAFERCPWVMEFFLAVKSKSCPDKVGLDALIQSGPDWPRRTFGSSTTSTNPILYENN